AEMQTEAPFELGMKVLVGQRDDALRLLCRLGPDDGRAVADSGIARQREDRKRSGRQEMLLRPPAVIALVGDGGDNGGLAIGRAVARTPRRPAERRRRAIGSNEKPRRERTAVRELDIRATGRTAALAVALGTRRRREARDRRGPQRHALLLRFCDQRR